MRQPFATLALVLCSGCSIIFSTGGIPGIVADAAPDIVIDAPFDGNPANLTLTSAAPAEILEGQGDGGSRPAILVIQGSNFVSGAQVSLTAGTAVMLTVDNTNVRIPSSGDYLAVPVTAHVDSSVHDGDVIALTITVTQPSAGGTTMQSLAGKLTLHGLDELSNAPVTKSLYSKVQIVTANPVVFAPGTNLPPIRINSVSSIEINKTAGGTMGGITARGGNANASTPGLGGAGGCLGGASGQKGSCNGGGNGAGAGGVTAGFGGGGAGFHDIGANGGGTGGGTGGAMIGDDMISSFGSTTNQASGGGGGGDGTLGLGTGGGGGGGGGAVELFAGGDGTVIGTIDVGGGNGGANSGGGGGGAGGIIVVHAGRTLDLSMATLKALGGSGAGSGATLGGTGSVGRIRWEAPSGTAPTTMPAAARGPSFVTNTLILTTTDTSMQLIGTPNSQLSFHVTDALGVVHPDVQASFASDSIATITPMLYRGYNKLCITIMGGMQGSLEATQCIDVAYLP